MATSTVAAGGRVSREGDRWFAAEADRDPKAVLRGRMEALGPIFSGPGDEPLLLELETQGVAMRTRIDGREAWCDRRLLARIRRYTLDRLRREIEPVSAAQFLRFLGCWQHADPEHHLDGPRGVAEVISQLAGFEVPAAAWEGSVLPARVRGYKREWLDQLTLSGEVAWARLWGAGAVSGRRAPVCLVMRENLDSWTGLAALAPPATAGRGPGAEALTVSEALSARGAMFLQELTRAAGLLPVQTENGLAELIGFGRVTSDSFAGLRWMIVPAWRRSPGGSPAGRWSLVARDPAAAPSAEFVARRLLRRTGVIFRKTLAREKQPLFWRDIARACRTLEARGEIRGGRFVAGFDGEQYALPEAIPLLRAVRRRGESPADPVPVMVSAADPLNFRGILTPDDRIAPATRTRVQVA